MKNKFLSSPEPGMGKIEADLLHLKCKTAKPCPGLDKNLNSSLPFRQARHRICLPEPISHLPVLKKQISHAHK